MLLEIVSDVVCPWCYIGKRHLDDALATFRSENPTATIEVQLRAFQLDPSAPLNGGPPVREAYARRFGGEEAASEIIDRVSGVARTVKLDFAMDTAIRANTRRAHRLLKLVQRTEPRLQLAVNESLMRAYFSEGRDIGDPSTLTACAERAGFPGCDVTDVFVDGTSAGPLDVAVEDDLEWCRQRDIVSVPTLVVDGAFQIPGAQEPSNLVRLFRKLAAGA